MLWTFLTSLLMCASICRIRIHFGAIVVILSCWRTCTRKPSRTAWEPRRWCQQHQWRRRAREWTVNRPRSSLSRTRSTMTDCLGKACADIRRPLGSRLSAAYRTNRGMFQRRSTSDETAWCPRPATPDDAFHTAWSTSTFPASSSAPPSPWTRSREFHRSASSRRSKTTGWSTGDDKTKVINERLSKKKPKIHSNWGHCHRQWNHRIIIGVKRHRRRTRCEFRQSRIEVNVIQGHGRQKLKTLARFEPIEKCMTELSVDLVKIIEKI